MLTISKDHDIFTGVIFIEVSPDTLQTVLDLNRRDTEERIKHMPGFVGCAILKSLDGERITEHVQWESVDHIQAAFKDPDFSDHIAEVRKISKGDEFMPHEVHYVDECGHHVGQGTATISEAADSFTAITEYAVGPENQQELLELIVEDHESSLRDSPGFLSVSIFKSSNGEKVAEHLKLESREAFEAFGQSPEFRAHLKRASKLAHPETRLYEVEYVCATGD